MLNSINSHSNYTYTNTNFSSPKANSQNTANLNVTNSSQNSTFVQDKSNAVREVLGYGVDKDGYFTSDFNEAVGLDKDYKIYAKSIENLAQELSKNKNFSSVNLVQTLKNAYTLFAQLVPNASNYDKEQIAQIPLGFEYDKKSFQITQIYTSQNELLKAMQANDSYKSPTQTSLAFSNLAGDFTKRADDIFSIGGADLGKNAYELENGEITKGGLFMAFANAQLRQNGNGYVIAGDTTIGGKLLGFDKNLSKEIIKDLNEFVSANAFLNSSGNTQEKFARMMKVLDLFYADLSVDEFKSQWVGLVSGTAKIDESELKSFGEIIENFMKENGIQGSANSASKTSANSTASKNTNTTENSQNEQSTAKTHSPIQAKSEIFKDMDLSRLQNVLKNKHKFDLINILFGINSSSGFSNSNGKDLNTNLMNLNLSQIKPLNSLDIKA